MQKRLKHQSQRPLLPRFCGVISAHLVRDHTQEIQGHNYANAGLRSSRLTVILQKAPVLSTDVQVIQSEKVQWALTSLEHG